MFATGSMRRVACPLMGVDPWRNRWFDQDRPGYPVMRVSRYERWRRSAAGSDDGIVSERRGLPSSQRHVDQATLGPPSSRRHMDHTILGQPVAVRIQIELAPRLARGGPLQVGWCPHTHGGGPVSVWQTWQVEENLPGRLNGHNPDRGTKGYRLWSAVCRPSHDRRDGGTRKSRRDAGGRGAKGIVYIVRRLSSFPQPACRPYSISASRRRGSFRERAWRIHPFHGSSFCPSRRKMFSTV